MPIGVERRVRWTVMVERDGENLVTIGWNHLSGKSTLSPQDEEVIRTAAHHLLSFVGREAATRADQ